MSSAGASLANNGTVFLAKKSVTFPAADGVRGVACLIVVIAHAVTMFFPKTAPYLAGTGKIGVWLFFVLSAFLLTTRLLADGFTPHSIISYALGRFFRIVPLFTIAVIFYRVFGTAGVDTWDAVGNALLFKQGFAHLWTVPVEFFFYFCLPLFVHGLLIARRVGGLSLTVVIFVVLVAAHQAVWPYTSTPINSIVTFYYFPTFGAGVLLAFLPWGRLKVSTALEIVILIAVALVVTLSTPAARFYLLGDALDFRLSNWFVYFGAFWALFLAFVLNGTGLFGRFLANPHIRLIGAWSFPIYLFHWLIFMRLIEYWPENVLAMLAGFFGAITVGAIGHYFLEAPIESLRKKVKSRFLDASRRLQQA